MKKCKILIPVGCRSDAGLSAPIIKRLKEDDFFEVIVLNLIPGQFSPNYHTYFETKIDIIFITGDRIEMTAAACWAFHHNVPIAHYFAGVLNYPLSTLDDVNRHCISLWADLLFVESKECFNNLFDLFNALKMGDKIFNIYIVGSTHLEGLEIDESLVPDEEYDLVLYNPPTSYDFQMQEKDVKELYEIQKSIKNKVIILDPNPDPKAIFLPVTYPNLPRPQFLGLLKNCKRFITNSSTAVYEAPYFLKKEQIIQVGDRNKNRTYFDHKNQNVLTNLASEKIIKTLKKWWKEKCIVN